jgi:hypothetical protein
MTTRISDADLEARLAASERHCREAAGALTRALPGYDEPRDIVTVACRAAETLDELRGRLAASEAERERLRDQLSEKKRLHTASEAIVFSLSETIQSFRAEARDAGVTFEAVRDILADHASEADSFSRTVEKLRDLCVGARWKAEVTRLQALLEDERVDRWHATRDAALVGVLAGCTSPLGGRGQSFVEVAGAFADAAHGPLDAVAKQCEHGWTGKREARCDCFGPLTPEAPKGVENGGDDA